MNTKLLFERGGARLQLWRTDYGPYSQPSFTIMADKLVFDFPACQGNGDIAIIVLKSLRAVMGI